MSIHHRPEVFMNLIGTTENGIFKTYASSEFEVEWNHTYFFILLGRPFGEGFLI